MCVREVMCVCMCEVHACVSFKFSIVLYDALHLHVVH